MSDSFPKSICHGRQIGGIVKIPEIFNSTLVEDFQNRIFTLQTRRYDFIIPKSPRQVTVNSHLSDQVVNDVGHTKKYNQVLRKSRIKIVLNSKSIKKIYYKILYYSWHLKVQFETLLKESSISPAGLSKFMASPSRAQTLGPKLV